MASNLVFGVAVDISARSNVLFNHLSEGRQRMSMTVVGLNSLIEPGHEA